MEIKSAQQFMQESMKHNAHRAYICSFNIKDSNNVSDYIKEGELTELFFSNAVRKSEVVDTNTKEVDTKE